jgi:hypothetical protein
MNRLAELENQGFRFRLENGQVIVRVPARKLQPDTLGRLRRRKVEFEAELQLRIFVRLVIAFGVDHGILLDEPRIRCELDAADRTELMTTRLADRQAWAQLLAYRLTHQRINW